MSMAELTPQAAQLNGFDPRTVAADLGTRLRFRAGDAIFREGDPPSFMYVVLTGAVEIRARERVIERIGPRDSLGVVALVDEQPRTATAVAVEDSDLALIDRRRFRFMVEETPHFCWYVMGELARRLRATNAAL